MAKNKERCIVSEMLESQREESSRRGKRPELFPPDAVRFLHQMAKQSVEKDIKEAGKLPLMRNTLNNKIFASKTAFSQLKLTTIPELTLEESAKGKYILVRVIEEWYSVVSWNTVIEDHVGNAIRFGLYNYPLDEMFSPGDVIVIKEPYLKLALDKMPVIRCDCPTDINVLRFPHPLYEHLAKRVKWQNEVRVNDPLIAPPCPTSALQWKDRGNELFARGQLSLAREAYLMGLVKCSENDLMSKIIWLNSLAVNIRLGCYEQVVKGGNQFLLANPEEKQIYFRLGKAHYMLRNFEKVLEIYEKFREKFPEDKVGLKELERAKERIRESKGEFDFDKLRKMSLTKPFDEIDCADFSGPVKITKVAGKGRGLVLTEDVSAGDLLVVSKAIAAVLDSRQNQGVQIHEGRRADLDRNEAANGAHLARLITKNPTTIGKQVYDLYSGKDSFEPVQLFCSPDVEKEVICDVELIKNIASCNSFTIVEIMPNGDVKFKGSGLFLLPSYINHSCLPNANFEFYNDVMVIKAAKDLKGGTELTVTYVPRELSFEERTKLIKDRGFQCRCAKCMRRR